MEAAASYWRLPPLVADGSHQRPGAAPDRFRHQSPEIGASSAHTSFAEHVSTAMAEISNGLANLSGTSASGTAGSEDDGSSEGHVELDPHEVRAILRQRAEKEQRRREHLYSRDSTVSPPASPLASPIKKVQIASTNGGASANQSQDASEKPRSLEEEPQTVKPQQFYPDGPDRDTKFLSRVPHPRTRPLSRFAVSSVPDRKWEIPEQLPIGHDNLRHFGRRSLPKNYPCDEKGNPIFGGVRTSLRLTARARLSLDGHYGHRSPSPRRSFCSRSTPDLNSSTNTSFNSWTSEGTIEDSLAIVRRRRVNELRAHGYTYGAPLKGNEDDLVWFKRGPDDCVRSVTTDGLRSDTVYSCS